MPLLATPPVRKIERFELITRDGRTYEYPPPGPLDRLAAWLRSVAEPAIISTVVLAMLYLAGAIAEVIEPLAADACRTAGESSRKTLL